MREQPVGLGMEDFEGLEPTGREIKGPIETLVEYTHPGGLKRTGIVFDPQYVTHDHLGVSLQPVLGFLENPDVCNLLEVTEYDRSKARFSYPTGTCWSVAELMAGLADMGKTAGARAGLELCYLVGGVLHEASQVGPDAGVYSHGNINPWRIMVKVDGQIQLIGYGLPQVDVVVHREEDGPLPCEDGLRYCPPERLEGNPEDVPGDILSLALVAFELMVGEPLYNGLAKEIHQQAINGQGPYRLFQFRDVLPESVIELLSRALKYDPDARFADANQFVWEVKDVIGLPHIDGMTLAEVVQTVRQGREQSTAIMGGKTSSISKEDLKAMRDLLDAPDAKPLPPPPGERPEEEDDDGQPRWGQVSRARSSGDHTPEPEEEEPIAEPEEEPVSTSQSRGDKLRDRLRQSKEERRKSLRDRLSSDRQKRRLRQSQESEEETSAHEEEEEPLEEDETTKYSGTEDEHLDESDEDVDESEQAEDEYADDEYADDEDEDDADEPQDQDMEEEEGDDSSEEPEVEDEPVSEKPEDAAAALLARLRSSQDLRASQSNTPTATPLATAVEPSDEAPAVETETIPARPLSASTSNLAASGSQRVAFQVCLSGQAPRAVKLKLSDSICETANRLGQALAGLPVDLSGRLTGWYRIRQSGEWISGASLTESLNPEETVEVVCVAGETLNLTIETEGLDLEHRFQAPVATHVPCAHLVGHLAVWLKLPAGAWGLYVNDVRLLPMQTLGEFGLSDGATVVVKL